MATAWNSSGKGKNDDVAFCTGKTLGSLPGLHRPSESGWHKEANSFPESLFGLPGTAFGLIVEEAMPCDGERWQHLNRLKTVLKPVSGDVPVAGSSFCIPEAQCAHFPVA